MNDIESEVLEDLRAADSEKDVLDAVGKLNCEVKTAEAEVLVNAAGALLADEL